MAWGRLVREAREFFREFFVAALDAIVPPAPASARTQERRLSDIPLTPAVHELLDASITTLTDYQVPEVRDLIRSLKYDGNAHAAHLCAALLTDYLREEISSIRLFSTAPVIIIPLPLHKTRQKERGFNQIAIVLERMPEPFKDGTRARLAPEALQRTRDTPHQTKLSRRERIRNTKNAFAVPDPSAIHKAHVFLIDDVTTTGATLAAAGKALHKAGAKVNLIALARA